MASYQCPFCQTKMPICNETKSVFYLTFHKGDETLSKLTGDKALRGIPITNIIQIEHYYCPECEKISIIGRGYSEDLKKLYVNIYPKAPFKKYPNYIPEAIRKDYEEAYSILNLSPKASATLSRRCLQGMIRDFWGIKKQRLFDEISDLKDKVPASQWKAIDGLRNLGNIGAHMEQDVNFIIDIDPNEAEKLIKLIEHLMQDWYIEREENNKLYDDITKIANDKGNQKH